MLIEIVYVNMIRNVKDNTADIFFFVCDPQVLRDVCKKNQSDYAEYTRRYI